MVRRRERQRSLWEVVETNVHYPTDSSLLIDGVRVLTRTAARIVEAIGRGGICAQSAAECIASAVRGFRRSAMKSSISAVRISSSRGLRVEDDALAVGRPRRAG